jgi:hypothetical protein
MCTRKTKSFDSVAQKYIRLHNKQHKHWQQQLRIGNTRQSLTCKTINWLSFSQTAGSIDEEILHPGRWAKEIRRQILSCRTTIDAGTAEEPKAPMTATKPSSCGGENRWTKILWWGKNRSTKQTSLGALIQALATSKSEALAGKTRDSTRETKIPGRDILRQRTIVRNVTSIRRQDKSLAAAAKSSPGVRAERRLATAKSTQEQAGDRTQASDLRSTRWQREPNLARGPSELRCRKNQLEPWAEPTRIRNETEEIKMAASKWKSTTKTLPCEQIGQRKRH